ncbi:EamA family transporter [Antarctobacter heliothermus]|uniref:EamA family transporter n=1 Tax=Antarctobacter heliothermus TaxID=74033 RepID=UPI0020C762AB|nr:EamA family transporter [Antarctobacter heliothermus]
MTRFRILAILAALCGALAIIRPGVEGLQPEALSVLAAAACWGIAAVLVRSASRSEEPLIIALWTSAVITVFSLPAALPFWIWPEGWQWAELGAIGLLTASGTLFWTTALRHGQTTQVIITDFVQLAWGVLIGLAAGEVLEGWSVFGIVLIASATLLVAFDKTVNRP